MASRYERNEMKRRKERQKKKRSWIRKFMIFLLIVIVLLCLYGKFIEPNLLIINDYRIVDKDLPQSFEGVKIVHFSDVHYGVGFNEKRLKKLVNEINSLKPDIVIFTGDLIDKRYKATDKDIETLIKYLSKIDYNLGKYATIGNHDFYNENYNDIMYDSQFTVLKNNYDTLYNKDNKPIAIYGIDSVIYGNPKTNTLNGEVLNNINYKIVILHEPDYTDEFINNTDVNLVLAGHSHKGQIGLPGIRPLLLPNEGKKYYNAHYKVNDKDLYVTNGVGNTKIDFRLFSTPSINIYRLSSK